MSRISYVYWCNIEEHIDIKYEGYVGVTYYPKIRFRTHKNNTINPHLAHAFMKYGDAITCDIIFKGTRKQCLDLEKVLRPAKGLGWNIVEGGGEAPDCTGKTHSKETRHKISIGNKGKGLGTISPFKGMTNRYSAKTRELIGSYHVGIPMLQSTKDAIAEKNSGVNNHQSKQIHLVHVKDLDKILSFDNIRIASQALNITYSTLRSSYQRAIKTQRAAGKTWYCLCDHHLDNPRKAIEEAKNFRSNQMAAIPKASGKNNVNSYCLSLQHTNGTVLDFESILQAAKYINMSDATLRHHIEQTNKYKKDSSFTRSGWKVKYKEVQK